MKLMRSFSSSSAKKVAQSICKKFRCCLIYHRNIRCHCLVLSIREQWCIRKMIVEIRVPIQILKQKAKNSSHRIWQRSSQVSIGIVCKHKNKTLWSSSISSKHFIWRKNKSSWKTQHSSIVRRVLSLEIPSSAVRMTEITTVLY